MARKKKSPAPAPTVVKSRAERRRLRDAAIDQHIVDAALEAASGDLRLFSKRTATAVARERLFTDDLNEVLGGIFKKGYVTPKPYRGKRTKHTSYITNVVLSDLHYRSLLDPREVPRAYNSVQEARRTGKVAYQVAEYKRQHRSKARLVVHVLGDIMQGLLHDARDGDPMAMQFAGVLHYLTQMIFYWASEYQQVDVYCVPGNHGRNQVRHKERAVHQKWDAIETMVYTALKYAVAAANNMNHVNIHVSMRPYYTYQAFNNKGFATHGDNVLNAGYPGKSIKVADASNQVLKWNNARDVGGPFQLFMVGHVHTASMTMLPNNVVLLTNGCLVPPDSFAISQGIADVTCGQHMFESVENHIMGDHRFITVDDADNEPAYEDIIKPFKDVL